MQGTGDCRWACSDCREPAGGLQGGSRGTAGTLQGDCRGTPGGLQDNCRRTARTGRASKKNVMTRPRKLSEGDCRGTAYYMFDCIGDCRGTLQGGLQGDCRKTLRGLQEDVPVNPGGKGAAGTLHLAQHQRTWPSLRGLPAGGTRRGLQGDCKEHCRGTAGKSWGDCKKMFLETLAARIPGNMWPSLRTGVQGGKGGLQENCRGTARRCSWKLRRQGYRRNTWPDCGLLRLPSQRISEKQKHEN